MPSHDTRQCGSTGHTIQPSLAVSDGTAARCLNLLSRGWRCATRYLIIDVRAPVQYSICSIQPSVNIPLVKLAARYEWCTPWGLWGPGTAVCGRDLGQRMRCIVVQ